MRIGIILFAILALASAAFAKDYGQTSAITVSPLHDAKVVRGGDGMDHVEYDLLVVSVFPEKITQPILRALHHDSDSPIFLPSTGPEWLHIGHAECMAVVFQNGSEHIAKTRPRQLQYLCDGLCAVAYGVKDDMGHGWLPPMSTKVIQPRLKVLGPFLN